MPENPTKELKHSPPVVKRPIARVVSQRLAALIGIVTILVGAASYLYSMAATEELVREQLMKFSRERGLRESALFLESDAYQARFQKEYVARYKRMGNEDPIEWFDAHLEKRTEDGTYRSKPELYHGKDRALGRRDHSASMMIGAKTKITPEVRRALAIGYDMINQYGPAWRKPFVDLYFSSPEKTSVSRWPGTPWGLMMDDEVEWREEEWMAITMQEKNPGREQRWSGVLYDERNSNWMVSNVTPLDIEGKQVGMVGTDLLLDDLVKRTINETLSGTYNILLQADGRVIAHPHMVKEIITSKGQLTAQSAVDKHLLRIYELARTATAFPVVINSHKDNEFLTVTRIDGPGWYFITVYPKSLLKDRALRNAGFTFLSGLCSLVVMILVILFVLKRNLVNPLGHLTQTIRDFEIGRGQWLDRADAFAKKTGKLSTRPDETGLLARSFVEMGDHLRTTYSELKESEEKYRSIVENAVEGLFQSTPEGRFTSVNPAFARMLGYESPEELVDKISDIASQYYVDPEDRRRYQQLLKESGHVEKYEFRARRKDGSQIWVSNSTRAYFDQSEKIIRYEGIVININERKQAEEEKAKRESQLRQAAKIEAIGTLAGGIAHDFNNILGIIIGNTELAMDDVPQWNPARINLDEIKTASMRAKNVVRQLLSFSRKSEQEKTPIKLHTVLKESFQLLRASIPSSVEFRSNIPTDLGTILADPTQIHQVIINLCTNAAHAMEENGGTLELNLSEVELDDDASAKHLQIAPGRYIQLTVSDTGSGIDPEIMDRIFDPYFSTKEVDKGTGIGLSVVHGIVKNHKAAISVYSEPQKGTAVKVLFPVIDGMPVKEKASAEELPGGNEKVLFIDDEKALIKIGQQILERLGYQVEVSTNPLEALEQFRLNPNRFDLVISDMTMPQMNGDRLAKEILKIQPDMPIIICTGFSRKINKEIAGEIGVRKFIEKPLNKRKLSIVIREVLDEN